MSSKIESASVETMNSSRRMLLVLNECFSVSKSEPLTLYLKTVRRAFILMALTLPFWGLQADAQVRPDRTLKEERSIVAPIDERSDLIKGGATRGGNLFHSFQDFNVGQGRGVFFANPAGIENILSRVTGNNQSNILGALGVLGSANLWLLNPNGVVFGPNARVQVAGSFFTSTADAIELGEQGSFSAVETGQSQLLSVSPGASFFEQAVNQAGSIINQGSLLVGEQQSVGLVGDRVLHTGTITASGGSVTLLGNQVSLEGLATVDVSSFTAGGSVLIGGDVQGGTVANADRTFIGPDVLIEANALTQGDGGRVVVGADEVVGFYGQVNARGGLLSGDGGFVEVSGKEHLLFRGDVDTSAVQGETGELVLDPVNITIANGSGDGAGDGTDTFSGDESGLAGSVLSQSLSAFDDDSPVTIYESELEGLSGNTNVSLQATNDIRVEDLTDENHELTFAAGDGSIEFVADADADGVGSFVMEDPMLDTIATNGRDLRISGASLSLGNIDTSRPNGGNGGNVELNATGDITSRSVQTNSATSTSDAGRGGSISFSTISGDITTLGELNSTSSAFAEEYAGASDRGGDISLSSESGNITTGEVNSFSYSSVNSPTSSGDSGRGGDISITSGSGNITAEGLNASSFSALGNAGQGGNISLSVVSGEGDIITNGELNSNSYASFSTFEDPKTANGAGNISLGSNLGDITTNSEIKSYTRSYSSFLVPRGSAEDGGDIAISSLSGDISINERLEAYTTNSFKSGGDIKISTMNFGNISTSAEIRSGGTAGGGGNIEISAESGDVTTGDGASVNSSSGTGFPGIPAGNGGAITISTLSGKIQTNGTVESSSEAFQARVGNGGSITISSTSGDITTNEQVKSSASAAATRAESGGDISISSISGDLSINGDIASDTFLSPYAGVSDGADPVTYSVGKGGDIFLQSIDGSIIGRNTQITLSALTSQDITAGRGGTLTLNSDDVSGFEIVTVSIAGDSGDVIISNSGGNLNVRNISLTTSGQLDTPVIDNSDFGGSGETRISSNKDIFIENFNLQSDSNGSNDAGEISINSPGRIVLKNSIINSNANSSGNGGKISLTSSNESILILGQEEQGHGIFARSDNTGDAGNIIINAPKLFSLGSNTQLVVETSDTGAAGNITINTDKVTVGENAQLNATATEDATNTDSRGRININAQLLDISGELGVFAETKGQSPAGTLTLKPNGENPNLEILFTDNGRISASTTDRGNGGNIDISAPQAIDIRGEGVITVEASGTGSAGELNISTKNLTLADGVQLNASTIGAGDAGNIILDASQINFQKATVNAFTRNAGNAGNITLQNADIISLDNSTISTTIFKNGQANKSSRIDIETGTLDLKNNSSISASTIGTGNTGIINLQADQGINLDNSSIDSSVRKGAIGDSQQITLNTPELSLTNQSSISATTAGEGNAGRIIIPNSDIVVLDDKSTISTAITNDGQANSPSNIEITTDSLDLKDNSTISASSNGVGNAGDIALSITELLNATDSGITTSAANASGGTIGITAQDIQLDNANIQTNVDGGESNAGDISLIAINTIRLNNSDILTDVRGSGGGGDIDLEAGNYILAFGDSDIFAFSQGGTGGNINLDTPIFIGESFTPTPNISGFANLDGNSRVDINASGEISSGIINTPDNSIIEESLTELPDNLVDTNDLLANSCIVRTESPQGKFIITGADSLRARPGHPAAPSFPTGTVRTIPTNKTAAAASANRPWQIGDPIVEPESVYRLPDGQLVISRECSE